MNQLHHGASWKAWGDGISGIDAISATMMSTIVDTAKDISVDKGAELTSWRMREFAAVCIGVQKPSISAMSVYIILD